MLPCVGVNLGNQGIQTRERRFGSEESHEFDPQHAAVKIAVELQQMRFQQRARNPVHGTNAEIRHRVMPRLHFAIAHDADAYRVDAKGEPITVLQMHVRGRKAHGAAPRVAATPP